MNDKQSNQEAVIFQAKDESGVVRSYEVLITFTFQDTGENCMIYQEIEDTQNGQAKIFASLFDLKDKGDGVGELNLRPIENTEQWQTIKGILDEISGGNAEIGSTETINVSNP